jgi:hypothetical protein
MLARKIHPFLLFPLKGLAPSRAFSLSEEYQEGGSFTIPYGKSSLLLYI